MSVREKIAGIIAGEFDGPDFDVHLALSGEIMGLLDKACSECPREKLWTAVQNALIGVPMDSLCDRVKELEAMNRDLTKIVEENAASVFGQENKRLKKELADLRNGYNLIVSNRDMLSVENEALKEQLNDTNHFRGVTKKVGVGMELINKDGDEE